MTEVLWTGKSSQQYKYHVHEISWGHTLNPDQDGNYIFAKVVNGRWQPVYIGQGDLKKRFNAAIGEGCVSLKGATHYHEHLNSNALSRKSEETDLILGNPYCRPPTGCNERTS